MPLKCDCYEGCWADHSKNWPKIMDTEIELNRLYYKCVKLLPYGTYVLIRNQLRIEKLDLLYKIT